MVSFVAVCGLFFNFNAPQANAFTADSIRAQIAELLTQISALQKQLDEAQGVQAVWCHTFGRNLKYGDSNDDVQALETALVKEGFSVTEHSGNFLAVFDEKMASSVVGFQQKYKQDILAPWGLEYGTGFVGKSTRAKLNALYGCGIETPEKSITVLSPNGGEEWVAGNSYDIKWISMGIDADSPVGITLIDDVQNKEYEIESYLTEIGDGKLTWAHIPAHTFYTDSSSLFTGNKFKIRVYVATTDVVSQYSDESDNYFSIVEQQPVTCTDSDWGKNYYVKGNCMGRPNIYTDETKTLTDHCITPRSDYDYNLIEYSCGYIQNVLICVPSAYKCPNGCEDGACKERR